MLLKSKFPSQLVDASVANELPQMNSKPFSLAGRCFIGTVRCSRILDLLCDCGVDAQICDGFCWYVKAEALKTISYYSMGSLVCVFIFAALLKKMVRPIWANVFNSTLATITAAIIYLYPLHWCVMPAPLLSVSQQLAAVYSSVFRSCQSFSKKQSQSHQYLYDDGWTG